METNKKPASTGKPSGLEIQHKVVLTATNYTTLNQYVELLEHDNASLGHGYQVVLIAFCDLLESQGKAWMTWLIDNRYRHQLPESVMTDIRHMLNLPLVDLEGAA